MFARAEQQGEEEGFGVIGGSAAAFWAGMLFAEAEAEGVGMFPRQGSEGRVLRGATLHRIFYVRYPRFSNTLRGTSPKCALPTFR